MSSCCPGSTASVSTAAIAVSSTPPPGASHSAPREGHPPPRPSTDRRRRPRRPRRTRRNAPHIPPDRETTSARRDRWQTPTRWSRSLSLGPGLAPGRSRRRPRPRSYPRINPRRGKSRHGGAVDAWRSSSYAPTIRDAPLTLALLLMTNAPYQREAQVRTAIAAGVLSAQQGRVIDLSEIRSA